MSIIKEKKLIKTFLINENKSIRHALSIIDKNQNKLCFVINKNNQFLKVVTDGDIRRYLLKNNNFNEKIINCHNRKSIFFFKDNFFKSIQNEDIKNNNVYPILNSNNEIVEIYFHKDLYKIHPEQYSVAVFGLGFVGLTLSLVMASKGYKVTGIEKNIEILKKLKSKKHTFYEKDINKYINNFTGNNFKFKNNLDNVNANVYIISVGTPVNNAKKTNFDNLKSVSKIIAKNINKQDLVILRSTVEIGTTKNVVVPIIEKYSKLIGGKDFNIAFCPERTIEGNALNELQILPQLIGGLTESCYLAASNFFSFFSKTIINMNSTEYSEIAKLVDNSYRDYNFGFSNLLSIICSDLGMSASVLINKLNTGYPRNNISLPSPGVGGPCLSKDPFIFSNSLATKSKFEKKILTNSRLISKNIVKKITQVIYKDVNKLKINKLKIFVLGIAFKGNPPTSDFRDSNSLEVIDLLRTVFKKVDIIVHDEYIDIKDLKNANLISSDINKGLSDADVCIFMNNNENYKNIDIEKILNKREKKLILFDCWSLFSYLNSSKNKYLIYKSL